MRKIILFLIPFMLMYASIGYSDPHTVLPPYGATQVQNAIDAADDEDVILIPAASVDWNGDTVFVTKSVTIQGAGVGQTNISSDGTGVIYMSDGVASRITGISFTDAKVYVAGEGFEVDHCSFEFTSAVGGTMPVVYVYDSTIGLNAYGVIHSNDFTNASVMVWGTYADDTEDQGILWAVNPMTIDHGNMVYIEDNTFYKDDETTCNVLDGTMAARTVFRHNTVSSETTGQNHGLYIEQHSIQGGHRAVQYWEFYDNTIDYIGPSHFMPIRARGGTGFVFNNTMTGNWSFNVIGFGNERSINVKPESGKCDGSSPWDGNTAIDSYVASLYGTPGTGTHSASGGNDASSLTVSGASWITDALIGITVYNITDGSYCVITDNTETTVTCTLSGGTDNNWDIDDQFKITNGYPCRDMAGRGYDTTKWENNPPAAYAQVSAPVYGWNNRKEEDAQVPLDPEDCTMHIFPDRDFFDETATFNGTSGMGTGLLANRPVTCTNNTAYFATNVGDQGTLYKCIDSTWTSYYEPYTYPHPARSDYEGGDPDPDPDPDPGPVTATITGVSISGGSIF